MSYELPKFTDEERLASTLAHAAHWENEARYSTPDGAFDAAVRRPLGANQHEGVDNINTHRSDGTSRAQALRSLRDHRPDLHKKADRAAHQQRSHRANCW
jgi:hypothetical protein